MMKEEIQRTVMSVTYYSRFWVWTYRFHYYLGYHNNPGRAGVIPRSASNHCGVAAMQHHSLLARWANPLATGRRHWKAKPEAAE